MHNYFQIKIIQSQDTLNYYLFWIIFHHFPTYFELLLETINHFSTNVQQNPPVVMYMCV